MSQAPYSIQPTVKQLLASDALAEAQVMFGENLLSEPISQVISGVGVSPRQGSLVVTRSDSLTPQEISVLPHLSALVLVKGTQEVGPGGISLVASGPGPGPTDLGEAARAASLLDAGVKRLTKRCADAAVPLIVVPSYGDPAQVIEDVRFVFLRELKLSAARLYSIMLSIVLDEGLEGLVESASSWLNRPLVVETAEYKVLASRNMGVTPASQQKHLTEEGIASLRAYKKSLSLLSPGRSPLSEVNLDVHISPIKLGRRLVFPVALSEVIVGYVSVMIRPQDDLSSLSEYMHPLSLACKVDFSHRLKDSPSFSVTQKAFSKICSPAELYRRPIRRGWTDILALISATAFLSLPSTPVIPMVSYRLRRSSPIRTKVSSHARRRACVHLSCPTMPKQPPPGPSWPRQW